MPTTSFAAFAQQADYSLLEALQPDPQASGDGHDHRPRQVFSGHYVPVTPSPLPAPQYVAHSRTLFQELGLSEALAHDAEFQRLFSGDITVAQAPMRPSKRPPPMAAAKQPASCSYMPAGWSRG